MKNSNYKQTFRPDGVIFLLVLVLAAGLLFKPLLSPPSDEKMVQARSRAESLGYQLLQLQADSRQSPKGRGPASVSDGASELAFKPEGVIGTDPWGSPYQYRVVQSQRDHSQVIELWSQNLSDRVQVNMNPQSP